MLAPTFLASPFTPDAGHGYFEVAAGTGVHGGAENPVSDVEASAVGAIGLGAGTMIAASVPWSFHWDNVDAPALSSAGDAKVFFVGETSEKPVVVSVYAEVKVPVQTMLDGNTTPGGPSEAGDEYVDVNLSFLLGKKAGPVSIEAGAGYTHRFGPPNDAAPWRAKLGLTAGVSYVAVDGTGYVQTEGGLAPEWTRVGAATGYDPHKNFTVGLWGGWTVTHATHTGAADLGLGIAVHG